MAASLSAPLTLMRDYVYTPILHIIHIWEVPEQTTLLIFQYHATELPDIILVKPISDWKPNLGGEVHLTILIKIYGMNEY